MEQRQAVAKLFNLKSIIDGTIAYINDGAMEPDAAIAAVQRQAAKMTAEPAHREPGQEG